MKIDITNNTTQELILRSMNENSLWQTMEKSFQENDMTPILERFRYLFNYTGEQLEAFKAEWQFMYADWYWENCPAE
jgi:hypothetical protein